MADRPRMRPRFTVPLWEDPAGVRQRLLDALGDESCPFRGGRAGDYIEIRVPDDQAHYWSPHLRLWFEHEDGDAPFLEGRFGPHPSVWTMFMAIYGMLTFAGTASLMFGLSQMMLDRPPWLGIGGVMLAALLAGIVYLGAFFGQSLGGEQMFQLRMWVMDVARPPALSMPAPAPVRAAAS